MKKLVKTAPRPAALTPAQVQAGLDAMSPADRLHTIAKAAVMRPMNADALLKRRGERREG